MKIINEYGELITKSNYRKPTFKVRSKGEARDYALEYQLWASEENLSYGEIAENQDYLKKIGKRYGLLKEFKEEGII